MHNKRVLKSKNGIKESFDIPQSTSSTEDTQDALSVASDDEMADSNPNTHNLEFLTSHPGNRFTKLSPLKNWIIPMMYYDGARLCSIFKLRIHDEECDKNTTELREDYAKIVLMMFYPFQKLVDIQIDGSY